MNSYSVILPYINEINSLKKTISIIKSDNYQYDIEYLIIISKKLTNNLDYENLEKLSLNFSEGFVIADAEVPESIKKYSKEKQIPLLSFQESQNENALVEFYTNHILK